MGSRWRFIPVIVVAVMLSLVSSGSGAVELGGFFKHTLYTQDGEPVDAYKPKVLLLLHGFKSAMPNHDYSVMYERFGESFTVVGFNYDYVDVKANVREFDELIAEHLYGRSVTIIGTSLGGFWANYLANRFEVSGAILVNPTIKPEETMRRALGKQYSKKRQESFVVTEDAIDAYADLASSVRQRSKQLVLLSEDDEVLDYRQAAAAFADAADITVVTFQSGGHNLELERFDVMAVIEKFIEESQVRDER